MCNLRTTGKKSKQERIIRKNKEEEVKHNNICPWLTVMSSSNSAVPGGQPLTLQERCGAARTVPECSASRSPPANSEGLAIAAQAADTQLYVPTTNP